MTTSAKSEAGPRISAEFLAESLAVLFLALVVAAANGFRIAYILFPELAALASDVLLRPQGKWAKEPWKLVATPTATAIVGILIGSQLPYGATTILLATAISVAVVFGLRSAVAPAISAGVLPIVLGVTSWLYPLCILCTLGVLTATLLVWRRTAPGKALATIEGPGPKAVEVLESPPRGKWWPVAFYAFVAVVGIAAQLTTWRFLLFPPLIVIAYEMLGHPDTCPWAKPPYTFPVACTLAALAGVAADQLLGVTPLAAALVLVVGFVVLRLLRLRMPPVLAIGLIPFVLVKPTYTYALSVALGTLALTAWFLTYRRLSSPPNAAPKSSGSTATGPRR